MTDVLQTLSHALKDRYHVKRELGAGGWATVYLATDLKHQREVALKVLRPEVASAIGLDRFVREIEISARLRHPNILPLYDSGEAEGLFYYVMPYVEGESLRDVLRREKQLPVDDALRISQEIADALALAHSHGVIHRDIKPENILLDAGHAVVADFGIARAVLEVDSDKLTGSGIAVGTPEYMSPEQAVGDDEVDARSDIYSLGCVLYEMLAGEPPFEGRTLQAVIARHMTGVIPKASAIRSTVPASVDAIVTQALAKVPADRFSGAERLGTALERARTGVHEPPAEAPASRSALKWVVLACAVLVLAGLVWLVRGTLGGSAEFASESPVLVVPPFANVSADSTQDYVAAGITEAVITQLIKVADLVVISGTPERLSGDDARDALLLFGSVHTEGDRLLITARLEEASTGRNVWAENYDRDLQGVLALYAEVARAITREIEAELTPEEEARLQYTRSVDPEAYNLYLRGRFHWNRRSPTELLRAVEYFERALAVDTSSALARAGLADAYVLFPQYGVTNLSPAEAFEAAERFARQALERDSVLGEARTALAHLRFIAHRDWRGAEAEFRRALDLSPGYAVLHQWYGEYLRARGDVEEGLEELRLAYQLAPQEPVISTALVMGLWCARRYEEAESQARLTLEELDSDYLAAHYSLSLVLLGQSRYAEMESAAIAAGLPAGVATALRRALEDDARRDDAVRAISMASGQLDHFTAAALFSAAGERDSALASLQNAEAQNDVNALVFLSTAPIFDFLRDDPRYERLLRAFGVPAEGG